MVLGCGVLASRSAEIGWTVGGGSWWLPTGGVYLRLVGELVPSLVLTPLRSGGAVTCASLRGWERPGGHGQGVFCAGWSCQVVCRRCLGRHVKRFVKLVSCCPGRLSQMAIWWVVEAGAIGGSLVVPCGCGSDGFVEVVHRHTGRSFPAARCTRPTLRSNQRADSMPVLAPSSLLNAGALYGPGAQATTYLSLCDPFDCTCASSRHGIITRVRFGVIGWGGICGGGARRCASEQAAIEGRWGGGATAFG